MRRYLVFGLIFGCWTSFCSIDVLSGTYTVKYGESLGTISKRMTGKVQNWVYIAEDNNLLLEENGVKYAKIIVPGQQLHIRDSLDIRKPRQRKSKRRKKISSIKSKRPTLKNINTDKTYQDVNARVFGHEPHIHNQQEMLSLKIDEAPYTFIRAIVPSYGNALRFFMSDVHPMMSKVLNNDAMETVMQLEDVDGTLSMLDLIRLGFKVQFNHVRREILIITPYADRRQVYEEHMLGGSSNQDFLALRDFKGYINLRVRQPIEQDTSAPLQVSYQTGINIHNVLIEADVATMSDTSQNFLRRGRVLTPIMDDTILLAGDLDTGVMSQQSLQLLVGAGIRKESTYPYQALGSDLSHYRLVLPDPSIVEIWVNDKMETSMDLAAGEYDVRDFQIDYGLSHVEIKVTDSSGIQKSYLFPFVQNKSLLSKGSHQYSYNVGVPLTLDYSKSSRSYGDRLAYALFHQMGFKHFWTLGGYLQGDSRQTLVGMEHLFNFQLGVIRLDTAFSTIESKKNSVSWEASYISDPSFRQHSFFQKWGFGFGSKGQDFGSLGTLNPINLNELEGFLFTTFRLSKRFFGETRLASSLKRDAGTPQEHKATIQLMYECANGLLLRTWTDYARQFSGADEWSTRMGITWQLGGKRADVYNNVNKHDEYYALQVQPHRSLTFGGYYNHNENNRFTEGRFMSLLDDDQGLMGTYKRQRQATGLDSELAAINYYGHKAILGGSFQNGTGYQKGQLRFETAVIFSNGRMGLSRPVNTDIVNLLR
ncbi:MAG: hypothetical protein HRT90_00655 [Candidatus Margulisbacteria bacterium]|nr:hypothetical protein [Candidatus Margulisiibacteriota bacterium]